MREIKDEKPDFTYFPWEAEVRRAKRYEFGAKKYKRDGWMEEVTRYPESYKQSALRHLKQYLAGYEDEDHLAAVAVNIDILMWHEEHNKTP